MADFTASRSSGFTYLLERVSRTNSSPSRIASSSVEAQYFPSRNSITNAGTPKAFRIRLSRSLRTTRPGNASFASVSSSSSSIRPSLMRISHISANGQLDAARRELLGCLDVADIELQQVAFPEDLS